jgi:hypothetical protein
MGRWSPRACLRKQVVVDSFHVSFILIYTCVSGLVTPGFKIKIRCSSYVCPRSNCHAYDQNVNTENQYFYYINFITRIISLQRRLYRLSHWAAVEKSNPTSNQPGATQASRRNLPYRSPSHLHLLNNVIARVSRLMVATQQVNGKI